MKNAKVSIPQLEKDIEEMLGKKGDENYPKVIINNLYSCQNIIVLSESQKLISNIMIETRITIKKEFIYDN